MLEELRHAKRVVGIKQLRRVLKDGKAGTVYLAQDADPRLLEPIQAQCEQNGVPVVEVATMQELGKACGIDVGAAAAATLRQ